MGKSKKDLGRQRQNLIAQIAIVEKKAFMDPLHKHPEVHEELAKLKKALEESR